MLFYVFYVVSFPVRISSVRSSQQLGDTQCCRTGQRNRRACEEQDGEIENITVTKMWPNVANLAAEVYWDFCARARKHNTSLALLTQNGIMVRCSSNRDGDSLHQLSLVSTKGQMTRFPLRLNSFTLLPVNELKHAVKEDHILLSLWNSSSFPLIPLSSSSLLSRWRIVPALCRWNRATAALLP